MSVPTNHDLVLLPAGAALTLRGEMAWTVESGSVAVFLSPFAQGQPAGTRRYLFTCRPGEVLLGLSEGSGASTFGLQAVALRDATLHPLALERFLELPRGEREAGSSRTALEAWIDNLTGTLIEHAPRTRVERMADAAETPLEAGRVIAWQDRRVQWFELRSGRVELLGMEGGHRTGEDGVFPAGSRAWLRVIEPSVLRRTAPEEVLPYETLMRGIVWLHALFLEFWERRARQEQEAERDRLARRQQFQQQDTADALRQLRALIAPSGSGVPPKSELHTALEIIGRQLQVTFTESPPAEDDGNETDTVVALARASRVPIRRVALRGNWWRSDGGTLLGTWNDGSTPRPVALLYRGSRYELIDPRDRTRRPVDGQLAPQLAAEAVLFYRPFPAQIRLPWGLAGFALRPHTQEIVWGLALAVAVALLGMLIPQATWLLVDEAIPDADRTLVMQLALALVAVACGQGVFLFCEGLLALRTQIGATAALQAATWDRVLRLPATFFRQFSSGDLWNRCMLVTEISTEIGATAVRAIVTGTVSLLNIALLFYFSARLAWLAVAIALVSSVLTALLAASIRKRALILEQLSGSLFGFVVQLIESIAKLRVAGAEQRAFNQWARRYAGQLRLKSSVQSLQDGMVLFNVVLPLFSSLFLFSAAAGMVLESQASEAASGRPGGLTMGGFIAFSTAFGMFLAGAISASNTLIEVMDSIAKARLIRPIFDTPPEDSGPKASPGRLTGQVALRDVTFRYRDEGPLVLHDVRLEAEPGEFVALVGPSGSGKSTLFRLLLGFETPQVGSIWYDGQELGDLDVTAVRRQIGVVLQQSRIHAGPIFEYLSSGGPLTLDQAWEVLADVGLAEEIQDMPMGIHTVLSEGGGNISGGQRQRLAIARALAPEPRILLLDEATSSMDNQTQSIVSDSIRRRNVTRLVIAHRLSTIQRADRIYVFDAGRIVQVGSFEELARREGLFQRLMTRQMT